MKKIKRLGLGANIQDTSLHDDFEENDILALDYGEINEYKRLLNDLDDFKINYREMKISLREYKNTNQILRNDLKKKDEMIEDIEQEEKMLKRKCDNMADAVGHWRDKIEKPKHDFLDMELTKGNYIESIEYNKRTEVSKIIVSTSLPANMSFLEVMKCFKDMEPADILPELENVEEYSIESFKIKKNAQTWSCILVKKD